uniref:Uncharacterized protein n=1 Tax=Cacopsylla melanoneura TaxID=428564 RepID=A0A8D9AYM5_9HEMI
MNTYMYTGWFSISDHSIPLGTSSNFREKKKQFPIHKKTITKIQTPIIGFSFYRIVLISKLECGTKKWNYYESYRILLLGILDHRTDPVPFKGLFRRNFKT